MDRPMDRLTDKTTDRPMDRPMDRSTDRATEIICNKQIAFVLGSGIFFFLNHLIWRNSLLFKKTT